MISALEALDRLRAGNRRFASGVRSLDTLLTQTRRGDFVAGQEPFAVVLGCSDSRVPVEIVFDQGLGDLFVVRNAGVVTGHAPLASVEFALTELGTRLVVVLAHERCGAFRAALDFLDGGRPSPGASLGELCARLAPALRAAGRSGTAEDRCERAACIHARAAARWIAESPVVAPLVRAGEVAVVPGYYRISAGTVEFAR